MPVSFNSPPRNFFLLGSSGEDIITNFFNNIDQSAGTDGQFHPDEIRYNYSDQKYILAGSAADSNSKGFGWFEKRDYNGSSAPKDWDVRVESTIAGANATLRALELDSADNLIVVGKTGTAPWIAKYSNAGVLDWQSTTNSGDVEYTGITSDANGNYYACGNTPTSGSAQAFVEKFDGSGAPGWGKSAFMLGRDVELEKIAVNSRGHVVAVGNLEDDNAFKGYIVKLDTATGDVLWDRTLESFEILGASIYKPVFCHSVFIDNKDQIYIVGRVFNTNNTRGFIIKYSPEGNIIWQKETPDNEHFEYYDVKSDGDVEQTIVLGRYLDGSDQYGVLTKYSKNGDIVFRRLLSSSYNTGANFGRTGLGGAVNLDADPSFYYLLFVDDAFSGLNGTPDTYTFGKVSTSGNGFGNFQYADGNGETIDYDLSTISDRIGKLSDGSVRNDTSDLTTYPFGANQILFDDLSTQVSNKRRQMEGPDSFEYSGSPAIRVVDFQEMNLIGDTEFITEITEFSGVGRGTLISDTPAVELRGDEYSGSGNWLDQSGSNNATPQNGAVYNSGDFGYFEFPNSNSYLQLSNPVLTTPTTLSVEMWVRITDITVESIFLSNRDSNTDGFEASFSSSQKWSFQMNGVVSNVSSATVNQDQWYHVVFQYDGSLVKTFIDGVQIQNLSAGAQTFDVTTASTIGTVSYDQVSFVANSFEIGELRVYNNKALTQAEAETNYNASKAKYTGGGIDSISKSIIKDQSGNGNDGEASSTTTTTTTGGTSESENYRTVTSSYSTYGTVAENTVTNDLPYNNADWSHYGGKVRDLQTGGFRIDLTGNSNGGDFFMACWIKFDTYAVSRQMGIDLFNGYVYWETLANGAIAIRHNGGNRADSSATSLNDGNWHHIALSRTGGTLYGMLDGSSVVSTTSGVSGASVNSNENFWFFGGSGTSYNVDAKILDPIVCIGTGVSGYSVPTEPVIDASGTFPNAAPHVPFFSNNWAYISPAVSLGGTTTTTTNNLTRNPAGYWEFNGTNNKINVTDLRVEELGETFTVEAWIYPTDFAAPSGSPTDAYPRRIMSTHRSNASTKWCLGIDTSGRLGFGGSQGIEEPVGNKYQLSLNTYYHVMLVHDGTEYTLYVDGIERANNTSSPIDAANSTQDPFLCIGGRPNQTDRVFKGRMGEVRAYLRPLTAAQVFQSYNATKSKYINEAPDTAPKISDSAIVYGSNLLLNYDFGNRATYDRAENLSEYSEDFTLNNISTGWRTDTSSYSRATLIANTGIDSPFKTNNASRWQSGDQTNQELIYHIFPTALTVGETYTVSCWIRRVESFGNVQFYLGDNVTLDVTSQVDAVPFGEWVRVSATRTITGENGNPVRNYIAVRPNGNVNGGDRTTIDIWGMNVNQGSTPGRYIRTYGSAITAPTTVKNLSSNSFPGTLNGPTFNPAGYFESSSGNSVTFSNVTVSDGSSSTVSWTFECWVKPNTYSGTFNYCVLLGGGPYEIHLAQGGSDAGKIRYQDSSTTSNFSNVALTAGQWNHLVVAFSPFPAATSVSIQSWVNNTFTLNTGHTEPLQTVANSIGYDFQGEIAEVRIYDKTLVDTEREQNFNATRGKYGV